MEGDEAPGLYLGGELQRLRDGGMTPSDAVLVLDRRVLKVVNQQIDFRTEVEARRPVVCSGKVPAEGGFVVGKVGDGLGTVGDAKAEGRAGVTDEVGCDLVVSDLIGPGSEVMKSKGGQVANPYRKQRWREIPAESLAQCHRRRGRTPQMHFDVFGECRAKEAEALKVIEMKMRQKDVDPRRGRIEGLVEAREA